MQTIAIISQKGGAGKTTLALHLAVAFSRSGKNTAIIDLDPQASSAKWGDRRADELPVVLSAHASRLQPEMKRVRDTGGEILILDTAPHSDNIALEAARAADLIIVPTRPAILDLEAVANTIELLKTINKPFFVVINAGAVQGTEAEDAAAAVRDMGAAVCPARLTNRIAFARSLVSGQTAQEFELDGKAALEIEQLHVFTREHLNKFNPKEVETTHEQQIRSSA